MVYSYRKSLNTNDAMKYKQLIVWTTLALIVLIPFFIFEGSVNAKINALLSENHGNALAIAAILFTALSLDIFLPVPSCLLSAMCGAFLGPCIGFLTSFLAMTANGFAGFFIGRSFSSLARGLIGGNSGALDSTASRGPFMLFILRPVPVLAECSSVYAGLRRYPFRKSALWLTCGNAAVSAVYVAIGHLGRAFDSPLPAFATVIILSGLGFLCGKIVDKKRDR